MTELAFCKKCGKVFLDSESNYLPEHESNCKGKQWCPTHGYPLPCAKCGLKSFVPGSVRLSDD